VADFLCRDLHEIQQKMSELGLTASYERAPHTLRGLQMRAIAFVSDALGPYGGAERADELAKGYAKAMDAGEGEPGLT
jgi:hypothetical protein